MTTHFRVPDEGAHRLLTNAHINFPFARRLMQRRVIPIVGCVRTGTGLEQQSYNISMAEWASIVQWMQSTFVACLYRCIVRQQEFNDFAASVTWVNARTENLLQIIVRWPLPRSNRNYRIAIAFRTCEKKKTNHANRIRENTRADSHSLCGIFSPSLSPCVIVCVSDDGVYGRHLYRGNSNCGRHGQLARDKFTFLCAHVKFILWNCSEPAEWLMKNENKQQLIHLISTTRYFFSPPNSSVRYQHSLRIMGSSYLLVDCRVRKYAIVVVDIESRQRFHKTSINKLMCRLRLK